MNGQDAKLLHRIESLTGKHPTTARHAAGGYTPAERWIVSFEDGSSCFAKAGEDFPGSPIAGWLRSEHHVHSQLEAPFLPRFLGWDDGTKPLLLLEDLGAARWPPPWRPGNVERVLDMLAQVRGSTEIDLPAAEVLDPDLIDHWNEVQADPAPFLSLGLCSEAWLDAALPALIEAAGAVSLGGSDLVHFDVRSDNLCFEANRTLLVDWNFAARGNGELDVAAWLPSLHSEGGPLPEEVLPGAPHWASLMAGFFAKHAGLPVIPAAPRAREVQLSQLRSALPWAVRALGLPPLDGPNAPMSS